MVPFASSNFLFSSVQNFVKVSEVCLKWLSSYLYFFLWFLSFGCILFLNLCSTKSPFSYSPSDHLYFLRIWVPLLPIQPLIQAVLWSSPVLFIFRLSKATDSHLISSCYRQVSSSSNSSLPMAGILFFYSIIYDVILSLSMWEYGNIWIEWSKNDSQSIVVSSLYVRDQACHHNNCGTVRISSE